MNKLLITALAVFVLGAAAQQPEPAKIGGNWQVSMETPHGTIGGVFHIQQEGSKLSGTCEIEGHGSSAITGTIEGKKVALNISIQAVQRSFTFNGTVEGAKMTGSTDPQGAMWKATQQ